MRSFDGLPQRLFRRLRRACLALASSLLLLASPAQTVHPLRFSA